MTVPNTLEFPNLFDYQNLYVKLSTPEQVIL